jgi:hypothetical protein
MDRPKEVTSVVVSDNVSFMPGQTPIAQKRVTFFVGTNGPFVKNYKLTEYSDEKVIADMTAEVNTLRAIGAIPAGS